jgi:hypothetical protein
VGIGWFHFGLCRFHFGLGQFHFGFHLRSELTVGNMGFCSRISQDKHIPRFNGPGRPIP